MAVKFKDYYETLGIARTASPADVKTAFRKLARLYHPDVAKNKATAEEMFKAINEANEVLSDPEKRKRYDELGANWQDNGAPPAESGNGRDPRRTSSDDSFEFGGTGFSDFFETYFSSGRAGGGFHSGTHGSAREPRFGMRGQDIEADISVSLEEALNGSSRKVTLRRPSNGTGVEPENTYQIRIKPGVREGLRIRLAGQGEPGHGTGSAGDLYLHVRLARHPDFTVHGADLHSELVLAPWEAVLGLQTQIPTLGGSANLRVPPLSQAGHQLRLRGLGLPHEDGVRGDLYVVLSIAIPETLSTEEKSSWENLARISTFKPRRTS